MTFVGIGEWLARREQLTPDKVGLIDFETRQRLTYRTLNLRARALARLLQARYALQPGERVAILARNAPEYLDALFACGLLGLILVPLNWRLTLTELETLLKDCSPRLLMHDQQYTGQAAELAVSLQAARDGAPQLLAFEDFPGADARLAQQLQPHHFIDGEEPLLILYTSGTTGVPKGALLSHRMLTWNAINTQVSWGLRDTDITPTFAPFFHAGGLNVLTTPLYHCGGTVVLLRSSDPQLVLKAIEQEKCTIVFAVPSVFQTLLESPDFFQRDLSTLRFCVTGGSSCPLPVIEGYTARGLVFRQGYGLTEAGVNCFSLAPEDAIRKAGSVGRPVFHAQVRIVDTADRDVPESVVGELVVAGEHVCSGYWKNPAATDEAFRGGWWHTGDLARRDEEGYYYIVGRKKDMLISGGENIYPAEVEAVLVTHPAILEVAVIAQPDSRWGEVGLAIIVPRTADPPSSATLVAFCADKLARYKIPKRFVFADVLPRNAMGKVVKAELRDRYID